MMEYTDTVSMVFYALGILTCIAGLVAGIIILIYDVRAISKSGHAHTNNRNLRG